MKFLFLSLFLVSILCSVKSQIREKEKVVLTVDASTHPHHEKINFVYPGCGTLTLGTEPSPCLTHLINKDLREVLSSSDNFTFDNCNDISTTLNLKVDKQGLITTNSVTGENLSQDQKQAIINAVDNLNTHIIKNGKQIIPAKVREEYVDVNFAIPFVIQGKGHHSHESFQAQGVTYNVFRNCDTFQLKEGIDLETIDTFLSEEDYLKFKAQMLGEGSGVTEIAVQELEEGKMRDKKKSKKGRKRKAKGNPEDQ